MFFLIADTQLYKRLCPYVRWSIGPLVHWSVGPSRSSWKREKRAFMILQLLLCVCGCVSAWQEWLGVGLGWGWGLDAPAHPSATILWPRVTCLSTDGDFDTEITGNDADDDNDDDDDANATLTSESINGFQTYISNTSSYHSFVENPTLKNENGNYEGWSQHTES